MDENKIPSGYLYAYLASKYGVPMITSATYGAIIQHIEPVHIADLPIPRLGNNLELRIHNNIEKAATLRTEASKGLANAITLIGNELGVPEHPKKEKLFQVVLRREIEEAGRLDGYYYNPRASRVIKWARGHINGFRNLGDVADVFDVPQFKHIYVEANEGVPFFTSGDLFQLDRISEKFLSKTQTKGLEKYLLTGQWVLLARSGQLGGIICRPQFVDSAILHTTSSDHVIRIKPISDVPAGYIFAYLSHSGLGYPIIARTISGSSIPALWPSYLDSIPIVLSDSHIMDHVHSIVEECFEKRVNATKIENESRQIIEKAIVEAAKWHG
ncbi:MAG TPA: hypothetical protein PLP29_10415 [Candidatus Ozemobacteraceae bacterium]|nr:hypothetical protein [Candidatus Ozemobacteraceae bacterium]